MDLRDITKEDSLLHSYKSVFVDHQREELLKAYYPMGYKFPIFTQHVFASPANSPKSPLELLDYKIREKIDETDVGRLFVLERTDTPSDRSKTRLFVAWASPRLVARMKASPAEAVTVSATVLFHPFGHLERYPPYWSGGLEPFKDPNFLELGFRYLCKDKDTVLQHLCAVRPQGASGFAPALDDKTSPLDSLLVVPVSSAAAFKNLSNATELEDALRQIARRCHEGVIGKLLLGGPPALKRVAVVGYSRSGDILQALFADVQSNEAFFRERLKEVYLCDVMLDLKLNGKLVKSKRQGCDELWAKLKAWQGDDADKRIRMYSAEPDTVVSVYTELKVRLANNGGGYHNPAVRFSSFNKTKKSDGSGEYSGLVDGYEIYSTDNSRSLVVFPSANHLVYLVEPGDPKKNAPEFRIENKNGFAPGGTLTPAMQGHSWFVSRLLSHALFHSGF